MVTEVKKNPKYPQSGNESVRRLLNIPVPHFFTHRDIIMPKPLPSIGGKKATKTINQRHFSKNAFTIVT